MFEKILLRHVDNTYSGNKLALFGNGGSAADCQHIATELIVRYISDRDPIRAMALTTDTSALTAIANDWSFDDLFARQVEAEGRKVTWTSPQETVQATIMVVIMSVLVALFLFLSDQIIAIVIRLITGLGA